MELDTLKAQVRGQTIKYNSEQRKERDKKAKTIQENILYFGSRREEAKACMYRKQLDQHYEEHAKTWLDNEETQKLGDKAYHRLLKINKDQALTTWLH